MFLTVAYKFICYMNSPEKNHLVHNIFKEDDNKLCLQSWDDE